MMLERMIDQEEARRIIRCAPGIQQETEGDNLGFGNLYYAIARWLRPERVLVIGSGNGFTPFLIAKALEHNGRGELLFVDPSMDAVRDGPNSAHGGSGNWDTPAQVQARFDCAGIRRITHYRMTNREFFAQDVGHFDLVVIDGAHDYANVLFDLNASVRHLRLPGFILLHDSTHFLNRTGHMGVARVIEQARQVTSELLTFPGVAGLTLVRVVTPFQLLPVQTMPPTPVLLWGGLAMLTGAAVGWWMRGRR